MVQEAFSAPPKEFFFSKLILGVRCGLLHATAQLGGSGYRIHVIQTTIRASYDLMVWVADERAITIYSTGVAMNEFPIVLQKIVRPNTGNPDAMQAGPPRDPPYDPSDR